MNPPASGPPPGATWDSVPCTCTYNSWMAALGLQFSATGLKQGIAVRLALAGCWKGADVGLQLWE